MCKGHFQEAEVKSSVEAVSVPLDFPVGGELFGYGLDSTPHFGVVLVVLEPF